MVSKMQCQKTKIKSRHTKILTTASNTTLATKSYIKSAMTSSNTNDVQYYFKSLKSYWSNFATDTSNKTFSFGFYYLRGLIVILFIDACLTDDEPL